jgi:hypothetical protein
MHQRPSGSFFGMFDTDVTTWCAWNDARCGPIEPESKLDYIVTPL